MSPEVDAVTRCGYVALVGRPNVGKSTLMNHLVGRKISVTSRKPQTTRHNVIGIDTDGARQAVYVDTPGIHSQRARAINRYMVRTALSVLGDVDLVIMLVEAGVFGAEDEAVLAHVTASGRPCICAINKIDRLKSPEPLLPFIDGISRRAAFEAYVPISALGGHGLAALEGEVMPRLPTGPHLFPDDALTDRSTRFMCQEIVREKIMRQLGDELPHRVAVTLERYALERGITHVDATIHVERESQKGIVIGRGGARLKRIGSEARRDIERLVDGKVMLELRVKVKAGWTNDDAALKQLGYD